MSDQPEPPDKENENAPTLEEQRRALMEEMRKDVATFMGIVKGKPPSQKPSN